MTNQPPIENEGALFGKLHEQDANGAIGRWLDRQKQWTVQPERVGVMDKKRPDIVIREGDRKPVIIETEYGKPAVADAKQRLGEALGDDTWRFTEIIALGIDTRCENSTPESLTELLDANTELFTVQFVSGQPGDVARVWPANPLPATPADLIAYCEYAQVPQSVITDKSREIADGVSAAGRSLRDAILLTQDGKAVLAELRSLVGYDVDIAATQTACAIWLIAIDLQNDLATHSRKLAELGLRNTEDIGTLTKSNLLHSWRIIKEVNYLPVVELAIASLAVVPRETGVLTDILGNLDNVSEELSGLHAKHIYNFAGELWQRLVPDREERAAHYTKPEVAELLSTLGVHRFSGRSARELAELDLMDAACGTGTLVGAGERALRRLHRFQRGQNIGMHKNRMENHIIAIDVNGIAGTLTAKRLTDMDVEEVYEGSKIAVTDHEAGSLSLLDPDQTGISQVLGYRDVTQTMDAKGNIGLFHIGTEEAGVDWSLMNPPYMRPRKDREQVSKGLQRLRAKARKRGYTLSEGQAGLASDFGNLSLMRLKGGGVLSHVLPLTAAYGKSWQEWREGLETHFKDIIAIAHVGHAEESMSADTGMNEMLMVATKRNTQRDRSWAKTIVLCVNLYAAPTTLSEGYALAKEIDGISPDQDFGTNNNFSFVRVGIPIPGFPWYGVGNTSYEFTAISAALMRDSCWDPVQLKRTPLALAMVTLGDLCDTGPTHHLIGHPINSEPIGAFRWIPRGATISPSAHQSLWAADSNSQSRIILKPTHNGEVVDEVRAKRIIEKRSQWFLSRNLRWTSQGVAFAKTDSLVHGGNAWNALQGLSESVGSCLALFYNSIFGAIVRQAFSQSTQAGRALLKIKGQSGLPCPDFGADIPEARRARDIAGMWFESHSELELEPFAYCFRDKNRHQIDSTVADMLGLKSSDPAIQAMLHHYRLLFASEPNVNGRTKRILAALAAFTE